MSICKSVVKFDAVPPCHAAPSVTLDQGRRLSRTPRSFLRAARVFLSGLVNNSPLPEVPLRREASIHNRKFQSSFKNLIITYEKVDMY
jgi:hypothetical protein